MSLSEEKKIFGFARDAWSIGCLLYCLLLGKLPFEYVREKLSWFSPKSNYFFFIFQ
jgi:serine/threonine protein kinase